MTEEEMFMEKKVIVKDHETSLLADLLYYNYKNNKDFNIDYIFNELKDNIVYTKEEEKEMIDKALNIVKEKYGVDIERKME